MATSTNIVTVNKANRAPATVRRDSLKVGDLFSNKADGRVFMHTGTRTNPPSQGRAGTVGYNSIVVRGKIKTGSDGAAFSENGSRQVFPRGNATITANIHD